MSEKMTRIRLSGLPSGEGFMDWGEKSAEEMISLMRRRAEHMRHVSDAILAADDADFQIDLVRGPYVQHHIRVIQHGRNA